MNKDLPEGWINCTLKDIGKIVSGGTPSTIESSYWGEEVAWITPADLSGYTKKFIDRGRKSITQEGLKKSSARVLPKGSVLFSSRAPIGYVVIAANELSTNQGFKNIIPDDKIDSNYLYYYLKFNKRLAEEKASGTTFKEISGAKFETLPFRYPPIEQQFQIVEKIEELFSELDKGIENLKTAQDQLKVYRQAVFVSALKGNFTGEKYKWQNLKLSDLCQTIDGDRGPNYPKKSEYFSEGYCLYLSTKNVRQYGFLFDETIFITKDKHEKLRNGTLKRGDIIITTRGTLGNIAIYDNSVPFEVIRINSGMLILRLKSENLFRPFLMYYLMSPLFMGQIKNNQTGTAQPQIPVNILKELIVNLPPFEIQQCIVKEIESRLSVCDKTEEIITESRQQAEALRQSILKRAFEGKLVRSEEIINQAKIVSVNNNQLGVWQRKVLAGWIIMMCYNDRFFGHTKFQKTLYLCENYAQLNFDTAYLKKAAGPLDISFFYPFLQEAKENEWIEENPTGSIIYFEPLDGISELTEHYLEYFKPVKDKINFVIKQLQGKNTDESELIATIYAIWNNFIIQSGTLDDENLVTEVYDWSESKAKFKKATILSTWQWMKEVGLVPVGFGKLISKIA